MALTKGTQVTLVPTGTGGSTLPRTGIFVSEKDGILTIKNHKETQKWYIPRNTVAVCVDRPDTTETTPTVTTGAVKRGRPTKQEPAKRGRKAKAEVEDKPRRGPGRPKVTDTPAKRGRKAKAEVEDKPRRGRRPVVEMGDIEAPATEKPAKVRRGPGRPRKNRDAEVAPEPKRRGRKPKMVVDNDDLEDAVVPADDEDEVDFTGFTDEAEETDEPEDEGGEEVVEEDDVDPDDDWNV